MIFGEFNVPQRKYAVGCAYLRGQGNGSVRAVHRLDRALSELGPLVTDVKLPLIGQAPSATYEGEGYIVVRHSRTDVVREAVTQIISSVRVELG